MKALIEYGWKGIHKSHEVDFPLTVGDMVFNEAPIYLDELISINVVPEEEYFLVDDGEGQQYTIPQNQVDNFKSTLDWHKKEQELQGRYLKIRYYLTEYFQYRVEGDWEKTYKITKR